MGLVDKRIKAGAALGPPLLLFHRKLRCKVHTFPRMLCILAIVTSAVTQRLRQFFTVAETSVLGCFCGAYAESGFPVKAEALRLRQRFRHPAGKR